MGVVILHGQVLLVGALAVASGACASTPLEAQILVARSAPASLAEPPAAATAAAQPARSPRLLWGPAYTREELLDAERRFGFRFPPDLFEFLLQRRFARGPDWTKDDATIRELMAFPAEGIIVDVERNDFWASGWGPRPATLEKRLAVAEKLVKAAPTLIPLSGEHYMPATPSERGNPVFSVFLTDVNYAGANIDSFAKRLETPPRQRGRVTGTRKPIPFWSELSDTRKAAPLKPAAPTQPALPAKAPDAPGERG